MREPAKPSIKDVARLANVSIATVSRVLNDNNRVKPQIKKRVLDVIDELHYVPSGIARNMRNQSKKSIGLVIADIQNPFFTDMVRAIEETAYKHQYTVLLGSSGGQLEKERLYLEVLAMERVSGFIIVPVGEKASAYEFRRHMPLVFVDRAVDGITADAVLLDNVKGGYEATTHLIHLGHRRIGLIATPGLFSVGYERRAGYERALAEHEIPLDEQLIRHGESPKERGGYLAARELLALHDPPTAIFAVNNVRTVGLLQAIQDHNIRIPQDISVIGFDDSPWLRLLTPPLTTVGQPIYDMGARATEMLIRRIIGDRQLPSQAVLYPPELIVRASTGPPSRSLVSMRSNSHP